MKMSFPVTVKEMKEEERVGGEGVVERWIPNTGEYLLLSDIRLNAQNRAGTKLDARYFAGEGNEVFITGAYDRGFVEDNTNGNIYNNSGCSFEVSLVPTDRTKDAVRIGLLVPGAIVDGKKTYTMNVDVSALYTSIGGHNRHASNLTQFQKNRLYLTSSGKIEGVVNGVAGYVLGIRPESAAAARPGDDLVLSFGLRARGANTPYEFTYTMGNNALRKTVAVGTMSEADYVAVYDKKMLWRANLYIVEGEAALGGLDWNDAHPWNAPPSGNVGPAWWSTAWGHNEWNRRWDGTGDTAVGYTGLNNLNVGNGGQVIEVFPEVTPVRTIGGTSTTPNGNNYLSGTVAYSYPKSPAPGSGSGGAGSQDSPFDYIKKVLKQKGLLADLFSSTGSKYVQPRSSWPPNLRTTTDISLWSRENFNSNVFTLPTSISTEDIWRRERTSYARYLIPWANSRAPDNRWWNYRYTAEAPGENAETKSMIPFLGLMYLSNVLVEFPNFGTGTDEHKLGLAKTAMWNRDWVIEAGSDCVGFANRAMSYNGENYMWATLTQGWTERNNGVGTDNIRDTFPEHKRSYPISTVEEQNEMVARNPKNTAASYPIVADDIVALVRPEIGTPEQLHALRRVVPGDIWVKDSIDNPDSPTGDRDELRRNHIAIVAYVPPNADSLSMTELMDRMILIEGEFTNKIQSVIKKLSVGDYNRGTVVGPIKFYPSFPLVKDSEISLNTQSWAIRRLK